MTPSRVRRCGSRGRIQSRCRRCRFGAPFTPACEPIRFMDTASSRVTSSARLGGVPSPRSRTRLRSACARPGIARRCSPIATTSSNHRRTSIAGSTNGTGFGGRRPTGSARDRRFRPAPSGITCRSDSRRFTSARNSSANICSTTSSAATRTTITRPACSAAQAAGSTRIRTPTRFSSSWTPSTRTSRGSRPSTIGACTTPSRTTRRRSSSRSTPRTQACTPRASLSAVRPTMPAKSHCATAGSGTSWKLCQYPGVSTTRW